MANRVTETASRWGNLYNFRYYVDGARVSKVVGQFQIDVMKISGIEHTVTNTNYGYKLEWVRS